MSLLQRLRSRGDEDWRRLLTLFTPLVHRWARRGGLQDADAADLVQEVFAAVYSKIDHFEKSERSGSFRGWLHGIARHKIADRFRKWEREPRGAGGSAALNELHEAPTPEIAETPESAADEAAIVAQRGMALIRREFEPRTWAAFEAVSLQGRPAGDVAAEMGLSVGAVYVAKSRVLKRLREELEGLVFV